MCEHEIAAKVCHTRHPLEWSSPRPRQGPCDDCTALVALVLALAGTKVPA